MEDRNKFTGVNMFLSSAAVGRRAELVGIEWLKKTFPEFKIIDVSKNKEFYGPDIDALVVSPELVKPMVGENGIEFSPNNKELWEEKKCEKGVEIKKDRWDEILKGGTRNVAYEKISNDTKGDLGCHRKTEADMLMLFSGALTEFLLVDNVPAFKEWCEIYVEQHPEREHKIPNPNYNTIVHLIELSELMKQPWIREEKI